MSGLRLVVFILLSGCLLEIVEGATDCSIDQWTGNDGARAVVDLNSEWLFHQGDVSGAEAIALNDSTWNSISIPHTWNTDLIKNQVNGEYYRGVGWYRKRLPIRAMMQGKRIFLRFEGALAATDVFVNGRPAGRHEGGYTAFCFEVTDLLDWSGENMLAVKVNNADNPDIIPDGSKLFTRFGGIYRPAAMLVTDPTCITPLDHAAPGVVVRQDEVSAQRAELTVITKLSNALALDATLTVSTRIIDASGQAVVTKSGVFVVSAGATIEVSQKMFIDAPRLWNGRIDPYLYRAIVEVSRNGQRVDGLTQTFGVRFFRIDSNKGFVLNGHHYDLHGVCRHQEWEHEGSALSEDHHRRDVADMVEIGSTAVRLAHYPQSATMYRLCDEQGLVVWAEIPLVSSSRSKRPACFANAKLQLREMIRQNINNPSIFFWGLYNEYWISTAQVQELHDLAKAEDPTRLSVAASSQPLQEKDSVTDAICWNRYPNWYGSSPMAEWADELHAKLPALKFGVSEYGAGGCVDQHQQNPQKKPNPTQGRFFPEEYQSKVHERIWPELAERPFLWGKFVWNLYDFSWPGVTRGSRRNVNQKGLITYDRQTRKDAYYYYKANWSEEPVLYITSRRHVVRSNPVTDIKVYSNCEQVELTLNGKRHVAPQGAYGVYIWPKLKLIEGENHVILRAVKEGRKQEDRCMWVYDPQAESGATVAQVKFVDVVGAEVSSEQKNKGHVAANALDRNADTFWCAANGKLPQWILLDLLQETDIGGVSIHWGQPGLYTYTIQTSSDKEMWLTQAVNREPGPLRSHKFKATTRFVRILCDGVPKKRWAAIREIQVLSD